MVNEERGAMQKRAEDALRAEQNRAQDYLDLAAVVFVALDADGIVTLINRKGCEILRCDESEIVGTDWFEHFLPEWQRVEVRRVFDQLMSGEIDPAEYYENPVLTKSGEERLIAWHNTMLRDSRGAITGTLSAGDDITDRKKAEDALRDSETRFRGLMERTTDAVFCYEYDPPVPTDLPVDKQVKLLYQGVLVECNDVCVCSYGARSTADVLGRRLVDLFGTVPGSLDRLFREMIEGGYQIVDGEGVEVMQDGTSRHFLNNGHGVIKGGKLVRVWGTFRDITDRKQAEEDLQEAFVEIQQLKEQLEAENILLRHEVESVLGHGDIVGKSAAMKRVLGDVGRVAATDSTVLILGETGVGKELVARAIHSTSNRNDHPLVTVNCAAMPSALLESELFGREKGAYTGALTRQMGRFEMADKSTIFLDEVGEFSPEAQAKLLRVLQNGQFERLGSSETITVDARVIAATNRDLEQAVRDGDFREDLYYRLNVFSVTVPPLRERPEDIPLLVWHFVSEFSEKMGKTIEGISQRTIERLQQYRWPGNVREVRNAVERAMILAEGPTLRIDVGTGRGRPLAAPMSLDDVQRDHIIRVLDLADWRVRGEDGAAEILGLKPSTLESRMAKLGIARPKNPR